MALSINTNPISMWASRQLAQGDRALSNSIERFATGQRINRAADDASGMAIADQLGSQARGLGQAIRNANDGVNMVQIADGALDESVNIIQTIKTKSLQAANGSQSYESRQAIQADIDRLVEQLDNIAQNTSYNGQKLLSGDFSGKSIQVGAYAGETVNIDADSTEAANIGDSKLGSLADINVLTEQGAQDGAAIADQALQQIDQTRSNLGSVQNQLESTIRNLSNTQVNVFSSESTIRDLDFAEESMINARLNTLNKARMWALAQSNVKGQNVVSLLGGQK